MGSSSRNPQIPKSPSPPISRSPAPRPRFSFSGSPRIVIAPASFKGSLSAAEAAGAIAEGVQDVLPKATIVLLPLSDGGEGLVSVLAPPLGAHSRTSIVQGPLPGQRVSAQWALTPDGATAIVEMASAAGLSLVAESRRDPRFTTTYGVGELVREALDAGASRLILGLGGSATNDGGTGMATALGYRFVDARESPIPGGGGGLATLHRIDQSQRDARLERLAVTAACDVTNPLYGSEGATMVYAPQKGGTPEFLHMLDEGMKNLAAIIKRDCGLDVARVPGSGAAGGLGGGVIAFLRGQLARGIDVVLDALRFEECIHDAAVVITGEGCLDGQTLHGKVMHGVLNRASLAGVPVVAVAGTVSLAGANPLEQFGLADLETLVNAETSMSQAIREAAPLLRARTAALCKRHVQP